MQAIATPTTPDPTSIARAALLTVSRSDFARGGRRARRRSIVRAKTGGLSRRRKLTPKLDRPEHLLKASRIYFRRWRAFHPPRAPRDGRSSRRFRSMRLHIARGRPRTPCGATPRSSAFSRAPSRIERRAKRRLFGIAMIALAILVARRAGAKEPPHEQRRNQARAPKERRGDPSNESRPRRAHHEMLASATTSRT